MNAWQIRWQRLETRGGRLAITSARGYLSLWRCSPIQRGFTLLEVVIVLFIIGIASAIAIPNLFPSDRVQLNEQATRLMLLLTQARDNAIAQGRPMALSFTSTGYQFWQAPATKKESRGESAQPSARAHPKIAWEPSDDPKLQAVAWPEGISLYAVQVDGAIPQDPQQKWVLSPSGINPILRIELQGPSTQAGGWLRQTVETDPLGRIELRAASEVMP